MMNDEIRHMLCINFGYEIASSKLCSKVVRLQFLIETIHNLIYYYKPQGIIYTYSMLV